MPIAAPPTPPRGDRKRLVLGFLLTSTLFTAGTAAFAVTGVSPGPVPPVGVALLSASVGGVVFGACMTWFLAVMSRRSGGVGTARLIAKALRTRTLREGIDPAEWRMILDRQELAARRGRWLYPLIFGAFAAVELSGVLVGSWIFWVFAAFFVALAVYSPFSMQRQLTRIRLLGDRLPERADPEPDDG
jgi:hypothetical protein